MNVDSLEDTDMVALLRLGNRLHELPPSPIVRHEIMLMELCKLSGAVAGMSALVDTPPREAANLLFFVYHGLNEASQQAAIARHLRALDTPFNASTPLMRLLESPAWLPAARCGNGADEIADCAHRARELCRQLHLGPVIFSTLPLRGTRLVSLLTVHRPLHDTRNFTKRQQRLVQLFHSQIEWTFRAQFATDPIATAALSPRQQQTLRHLLAGDSEKQIAQKLSRSPHTVHSYVKAIYRNFHVSSRGELLALFVN